MHKQTLVQLEHHSFRKTQLFFFPKMHKSSGLRYKRIQKVDMEPQEVRNFEWVLSIYMMDI